MEKEHEWTPEELKQFAQTRENSYSLWVRLENEHPGWPYQQLAKEFINQAKSLPYTSPTTKRR